MRTNDKPTQNSDRPCCVNCTGQYLELGEGTCCKHTHKRVRDWDTCDRHEYQRTGGGYFYG